VSFSAEKHEMSRGKGGRDVNPANVVALEALLRDVESLWERVTSLAEKEQLTERSPEQVNGVVSVVERAQRAVAAVSDCLDELPAKVIRVGKKATGVAAVARSAKQKGGSKGKKKGSVKGKRSKDEEKRESVRKPSVVDKDESGQKGGDEEEENGRASGRLRLKSKKAAEMEDDADDEESGKGKSESKSKRSKSLKRSNNEV
jgi:hypothetical protein